MRRLVFAIAALCVLFWAVVVFRGDWLPRRLDSAGAHGVLLILVVPALALALAGRWLGVALILACAAAFLNVSVVIGGMISN